MSDEYEGWTILELFGHRRLAGYVREVEVAGGTFLRVDVPGPEPGTVRVTQFYGAAAIYCMTPTTEEIARGLALRYQPAPAERWELPPAPAQPPQRTLFGGAAYGAEHQDDEEE